jgi:dihydroneopterin aldolase
MSRSTDWICLTGIECRTHIGVTPEERALPQRLSINLELGLDLEPAGHSDQLELTLDYSEVVGLVRRETARSRFQLIEALAGHLLQLLMELPRVESARIEIEKFPADLRGQVGKVAVRLSRTRTTE